LLFGDAVYGLGVDDRIKLSSILGDCQHPPLYLNHILIHVLKISFSIHIASHMYRNFDFLYMSRFMCIENAIFYTYDETDFHGTPVCKPCSCRHTSKHHVRLQRTMKNFRLLPLPLLLSLLALGRGLHVDIAA
jgi:hypothetical protein